MPKKKVISENNLPTRFPFFQTATYSTMLDYWNAPDLIIGSFIVLFALIWIGSIVKIYTEKQVDILNDNKEVI